MANQEITVQKPATLDAESQSDGAQPGKGIDVYARIFTGYLVAISSIIAALPLFLQPGGDLPSLGGDFKKFGASFASIVSFLGISMIFFFRDNIFAPDNTSEYHSGASAIRIKSKIYPVFAFIVCLFAMGAYYYAYQNNITLSIWPLFAYILIFSAPSSAIAYMALGEYARAKS